jgi:hypothetical protein
MTNGKWEEGSSEVEGGGAKGQRRKKLRWESRFAEMLEISRSPLLSRRLYVAKSRFWRHKSPSLDLRCVLRQDRVGTIELALKGVGARLCRDGRG